MPRQASLDSAVNPSWNFHAPNISPTIIRSNSNTDLLQQIAGLPRGLIGYFSYDLARTIEPFKDIAADDLQIPALAFLDFNNRVATAAAARTKTIVPPPSTFTRQTFCSAARRVIELIRAGDVFQVNLAQRFSFELRDAPWNIYQRLHTKTPGRFDAFLDFGDFQLISNSPELFLHISPDRKIITRPIKGTRPIGAGMREELLNSKKDQAELAMIVDLERNDLGRICEIGSVRVTEPREIETHPTVHHGVATIEGRLRADVSFADILRATFPSGSVTGAPKIRAMQIIEELEPVRRGPYCGAIGHIHLDGSITLSVAIRTMIVKAGIVHVYVGAGIVADSDPEAEYEETMVKARAMLAAIGEDVETADERRRTQIRNGKD